MLRYSYKGDDKHRLVAVGHLVVQDDDEDADEDDGKRHGQEEEEKQAVEAGAVLAWSRLNQRITKGPPRDTSPHTDSRPSRRWDLRDLKEYEAADMRYGSPDAPKK